jgi:glutamine synthetase
MAWGVNNRTTALRIPHSQPEALRIEHRVAGADANPYLVVAGILAGAHYGLQHKLQPPPAVEGNAYARAQPQLLRDWTEARLQFEDAKRLRRYLGGAFCDLYAALKAEEQRKFYRAITRLEYDWYLRAL